MDGHPESGMQSPFRYRVGPFWSGSCAKHEQDHDGDQTVYGLNSVAVMLSIMSTSGVDTAVCTPISASTCLLSTNLERQQKTAESNI